jgi:hypothetical protein
MRKASCWMILVALLTITAPTAFADSYSIVFSAGLFGTPVDPSISVPASGELDLGTVTYNGGTWAFPVPLSTSAFPQNDAYIWLVYPSGIFLINDSSTNNNVESIQSGGTPNPFFDSGSATVSFNSVATPEPSPVVLTLIGMGLLVVMRKRKALGLAQAT